MSILRISLSVGRALRMEYQPTLNSNAHAPNSLKLRRSCRHPCRPADPHRCKKDTVIGPIVIVAVRRGLANLGTSSPPRCPRGYKLHNAVAAALDDPRKTVVASVWEVRRARAKGGP